MKLKKIEEKINNYFYLDSFKNVDPSLNGVQFGDYNKDIKKIALAVDASEKSILQAIEHKADLLLVHHGIIWNVNKFVRNNFNRINLLSKNNLALFAIHLPLDAHDIFGNNIQIGNILSLIKMRPFGIPMKNGKKIGIKGEVNNNFLIIEEIVSILKKKGCKTIKTIETKNKKISKIGIVSGGGARHIHQAIEDNLDLLITGDQSHSIYYDAIENNVNVIFAGHYFTETFGVKALKYFFNYITCKSVFIDIPTGF